MSIILYIVPTEKTLKARLRVKLLGRKHNFQQDGFLAKSLIATNKVDEKNSDYLLQKKIDLNKYSYLFINSKATTTGKELDLYEELAYVKGITSIPKVLVITNAKADGMPTNRVLDLFDVVIKREPFKDLDKYQISNNNKQKIIKTMIACPFGRDLIPVGAKNISQFDIKDCAYDFFFSGSVTNPIRYDVWHALKEKNSYSLLGGLQSIHGIPVPESYKASRLNQKEYVSGVLKSKFNLALEGIGEFTYRHLELWSMGAFVVSTPSINDQDLCLEVKEGEHYISFESPQDMIDKCEFYMKNPDKMLQIKKAGYERFVSDYNYVKHGNFISNELESKLK